MKFVEFLEPLANSTDKDKILAALYYREQMEREPPGTVEDIRPYLIEARVSGAKQKNISQALNTSGARVHGEVAKGGRKVWQLTKSGCEYVRTAVGLSPEEAQTEHEAAVLEGLVSKVPSPNARSYLEEALKCLRADALRACVVFVWSGTIRTIHERMLDQAGAKKTTAAVRKHHGKAKDIRTVDDFAYTTDNAVLLAATDLGLFDKGEKRKLSEALSLRTTAVIRATIILALRGSRRSWKT